MLTKEQYAEHFKGHNIVDVVVRDRSRFYFVMNDFDNVHTDVRLVRVALEDDQVSLKQVNIYGYDPQHIYCSMTYPEDTLIVMDMYSNHFVGGKGTFPEIEPIGKGGPLGGSITRIKTIGRSPAIVSSTVRDLLMRHEDDTWHRIGPQPDPDIKSYEGFEDFDGFGLDDIYAASSEGLFHFDGKAWTKVCAKKPFCAVGCTPDGYVDGEVYAATWTPGEIEVYRGRGQKWTKIYSDKGEQHTNPVRDIVWHDGRVWMGNWSGQYAFKDGKYVKKFTPGAPSGGFLSATDGLLVAGSARSAYFHREDEGWHTLFEGWKLD